MTTGQTIETKIVVDAKQAAAEVDKFNGKLSAISGALSKPIGSLDDLQKGAKKLQERMAPTAAAISGVASALGQTGGESAKVVAGVGQMAAAFGAGGPWAVAIVGGTLLLDEYLKAQKEVEENARLTKQAMESLGDTLVNKSAKGLQAIREKADAAAEAVRNFGKTAQQIDVDAARTEINLTERRIRGLDELIERRQKNAQAIRDEPQAENRQELIERLKRLGEEAVMIRQATDKREALTKTLKAQQDETRRMIAEQERLNKKEAESPTTGKASVSAKRAVSAVEAGPGFALRFYRAQQQEEAERAREERRAALEKTRADIDLARDRVVSILQAEDDAEDAARKAREKKREEDAEKRIQLAKETADQLKAIEKQQQDFFVSTAQNALSTTLSTTQSYIEAKINGEKDAEQKAVASFLSATGQQLVGSGTRAIFEGLIANAAIPGSGVPLMATGAAAIAAGVGMGAGSAAVSTSIAGTGGSGERMAARDRGASPRSSGGGGGGGPLVINVSYGVGGPLPEDTAREIAKVMRTGDRRRGAA